MQRSSSLLRHLGYFVLRSPLLPLEELSLIPVEYTDCAIQKYVEGLLIRKEIREAIFVSSPDLLRAIDSGIAARDKKKARKLAVAVHRYHSRMIGTPTPFGLMAGHSTGRIAQDTQLQIPERSKYRRHTSIDFDYACELSEWIEKDEEVRAQLRYRRNETINEVGSRIHYSSRSDQGGNRGYHLMAVDRTPYLVAVLERAGTPGCATINEMAEAVMLIEQVSLEEAIAYIGELIDSRLLVNQEEVTPSGAEPVQQLLALPIPDGVQLTLTNLKDRLESVDSLEVGQGESRYREIVSLLERLPVPVSESKLFNVVLMKKGNVTLSEFVVRQVQSTVGVLERMGTGTQENTTLQKFCKAFRERYEGREVPLLEVLDEEAGIGYGAPDPMVSEDSELLDGIAWESSPRCGEFQEADVARFRLVERAAREGLIEIELGDKDIEELCIASSKKTTTGLTAFLSVGRKHLALYGAYGPTATRYFSRFLHADADLKSLTEHAVSQEELIDPQTVFAEVVHLPEGHVANVVAHPHFRKAEIPCLGNSHLPANQQVALSDLMVSVFGQEVRLRSRSSDKRIVPCITNAHNLRLRNPPAYKFLGSLQGSLRSREVNWTWRMASRCSFLPRIRIGEVIVAPARWAVSREEILRLAALPSEERNSAVSAWRQQRKIPSVVYFGKVEGFGHDGLLMNLETGIGFQLLIAEAKDRNEVYLVEPIPAVEDLAVNSPEGHFVHEILLPLLSVTPEITSTSERRKISTPSKGKRSFLPLQEWVYLKIYCGVARADALLTERFAPVIEKLRADGAISQWFFIRYADPEFHIRLRLKLDKESSGGNCVAALYDSLEREPGAWKIQLDTYEREVERYGGFPAIEIAEEIFHLDTYWVLRILERCRGQVAESERWLIALGSVNQLLSDCGLTTAEKAELIGSVADAFAEEYGLDKHKGIHAFAEKFRRFRHVVQNIVQGTWPESIAFTPELLAVRSAELSERIRRIKVLSGAEQLTTPITEIWKAIIHMHVNRLLRSAQRKYEAVIYDFLRQVYKSQMARESRGISSSWQSVDLAADVVAGAQGRSRLGGQ